MPLEPIEMMMTRAAEGGYAVGYFESWDMESLQAVVDAAEECKAPVIIGFNGEFLSNPKRRVRERLELYGCLGRKAAETAKVPCGFIFNECPDTEWVYSAVTAGFNLVMPADSGSADRDFARLVREITRYAHGHGVAVEAELGELPWGPDEEKGRGERPAGEPTDPEDAARFVEESGVDLLAVSVGNIHVKLTGRAPLDIERLAELSERVDVPLVLHGGSGIDDESLGSAIVHGVSKVNYGTYLKQRYLDSLRRSLDSDCTNPHELIGTGGADDIQAACRIAVREAVLERMPALKCEGKAW